jgi:hypothetical protein
VIVRTSRKVVAAGLLALLALGVDVIAVVQRSGPLLLLALVGGFGAILVGKGAQGDIDRSHGALRGGRWLRTRSLALALGLCLGVWGLTLRELLHTNNHRFQPNGSFKAISAALVRYADNHDRRFPPPFQRDQHGTPLLSWRVLILPYLGETTLYEAFRLDEPWDSPHNLALLPRMPSAYKVPVRQDEPFTTPFLVFVGPGAAFEEGREMSFLNDFPRGPGNTVLVVEARTAVPWTKPEDFLYAPGEPLPSLGPLLSPWFGRQGREIQSITVCMADGTQLVVANTPGGRADVQRAIQRLDPGQPQPARRER